MANPIRKEQAVVDLVINGRAAETSIKGIQKATFETEKLLRNMSKAADPVAYEKMRQELLKLKAVQSELNSELREGAKDFEKFQRSSNSLLFGVGSGNLLAASVEKALGFISKAPQEIARIADEITNVGKTTGLADDEVEKLFNSFAELDTRSTRTELSELASIAGKLGENTLEGATDFVKGADVIKVALAKDLGGNAEEAITKIAKIIEIFDLKKEFGIQQSFLKVGSAINALGASSSANEEYIVNFTTRMAGIAPTANIATPDVLGLAAAMDQLGQSPELASTNIGKMLLSLGKDVPYFSKVAGMSVKEFSKLLKTDANEAFLRVIEGASKSGKGLEGLAGTFKTLGIEGSEGAQVIGALAGNIDLVRESQRLANTEFDAGTSVLEEYNRANNNSAAILDKIGKKISNMWMLVKEAGDPIIRFLGGVMGVVDPLQARLGELNDTGSKAAQTAQKLEPLLKKYETLREQLIKGKDVQKELNEVTQQIAKITPTAATAWDSYGNAIGIATDKVREFLGLQRQSAADAKTQSTQALQSELARIQRIREQAEKQLNSGKTPNRFTLQSKLGQWLGIDKEYRKATDAETAARREHLLKLIEQEKNLRAQLESIKNPVKPKVGTKPPDKPDKETDKDFIGDGPGKKEVDKFRQFKQELKKLEEEAILEGMKAQEREFAAVAFKYARMREEAKGNKEFIVQINELETKELANLAEKHTKKSAEEAEKRRAEAIKKLHEEIVEREKLAEEARQRQAEGEKALADFNRSVGEVNRLKNKTSDPEQVAKDEARQRIDDTKAKIKEQFDKAIQAAPDELRGQLAATYGNILNSLEQQYYAESDKIHADYVNRRLESYGMLATNISNIMTSFMEVAGSNATDFAEFQKMATLVQITVDTAKAISAVTASGALVGLTPIEKAVAITGSIAVVLANIAKAKAVLTQADKLQKPQFERMPGRETGGSTDLLSLYMDRSGNPQGYINRPTLFNLGARSWIGGEGGKKEYVFSYAMLQNPVMARFAAMAETLRTTGYDFTRRADMAPGPQQEAGGAELLSAVQLLIAETRRHTAAVERFEKKPWSTRRLTDALDLDKHIESEAGA